ncbi:MAG: hypothetical protein IPH07_18990 [Deltaproteobacteria bacterium]|nr:hypothetical protein [Deltaproteobacteria bacterium]MBK8715789.1 hypothetical protein [Deltaproteobacteria bacterium]MBP7288132.1 hypothetical protein [Nannocystaceae bacterium]
MTLVATIALALHGLLGPPDVVVAQSPGDDDPLELTWSAPDGCPDAAQVREHVQRRAGTTALRRTLARGRIERLDDSTWMLELVLEGDDGAFRRELRGTSCEALTAAAGLLIAVAADPTTRSGAPPDEAAPPLGSQVDEDITNPPAVTSAAPPSRPPPTPRASDTRAPVETSMRTRTRGVDAALRVDIGGQFLRVLPAIADASFGGALAVRWPRARAELRGRYLPGQRSRYADRPSLGGVIDLWTLGASGCYAPRWQRLEFPICAGIELGMMRGRSFGAIDNRDAAALFAALPLDAALVWSPIRRVGLLAGLGVSPTLRRPGFHVRDLDPVFVAAPVAVRVAAGLEVRFP